jgi:hypothetical protein
MDGGADFSFRAAIRSSSVTRTKPARKLFQKPGFDWAGAQITSSETTSSSLRFSRPVGVSFDATGGKTLGNIEMGGTARRIWSGLSESNRHLNLGKSA